MWLYISVPVLIFVVFTNSIVLWLILNMRRLQTLRNVPLIGLATADVLVGLFWIPLATASGYLPENKDLCRAALSCEILTTHASLFNLIAVSAERWIAIFKPLHYHQIASQSVVGGLLAVSWILSFGMLIVFLATDKSDNDIRECDIVKYIDTWFLVLILVIFYIVCGIMIFMQLKVYLIVRAQIRRIRPTPYPGDVKNGLMAATSFIIEESFNINAALADDESESQREQQSGHSSVERALSKELSVINDIRRKTKLNDVDSEGRRTNQLGKKEACDLLSPSDSRKHSNGDSEKLIKDKNISLKVPGIAERAVERQDRMNTGEKNKNMKCVTLSERVEERLSEGGKCERNHEIANMGATALQLCVEESEDNTKCSNDWTAKLKNLTERRTTRQKSIDNIFCVERESEENSPKPRSVDSTKPLHENMTAFGSRALRLQKITRNKIDRKKVYYSPDSLTTKKKKRGPKTSFASFVRLFSVIKRQRKSEFTRAIATNVVCLCFVLMWAPKSTIDLLTGLGHCTDCAFAHSISAVLAWTNSGINALIYAWRMHEFREALRAIWFNQMNRASR
ncbi:muscarinic acetylcholine receptor M3-like [Rhopilema esculentum]|uniref:muscarinic acetylcholine receptor M3-like n=1 Tax=Rhopilema esculentum TaxID=499914 RepID=UPI0031D4FCA8